MPGYHINLKLEHQIFAGGIAFGVAIDYMNKIGFENIANYEKELLDFGTEKLLKIDGLKIYGTSITQDFGYFI